MPLIDRETFDHQIVVIPGSGSRSQLRFVQYTAGLCFLALLLLFLLIRKLRAFQRASVPIAVSPEVTQGAILQQRLWLSEKSRGVSTSRVLISTNYSPEASTEMEDGNNSQILKAASHSVRQDSKTEHAASKADSALHLEANTAIWHMKARPRPPPPLTPPVLSAGPMRLENRRLGMPVSASVEFDKNFFGLPNPDYMSATSDSPLASESSASTSIDHRHNSPTTPRRRSYTKTLQRERISSVPDDIIDSSASLYMANSFPSSSPSLPLAPHAAFDGHDINVQGEIISVLDDAGSGWKRHTRVYGGGVCLACLASEGQEDGASWGPNVRPEDRRY